MKNTLPCFILLLAASLSAQNPYYDALALREYIVTDTEGNSKFMVPDAKSPEFEAQTERARAYCELINTNYYDDSLGNIRDVHLALSTPEKEQFNPFLEKYLTPSIILSRAPSELQPGRTRAFAGLGKLDVTYIADGFARFIVERTKKELQAAFFDRFIREMRQQKYNDIRCLFPATCALAEQLPQKIFTYETYIQSLRDAFGNDMQQILPHLEDVLRNGEFKPFFEGHPELKSICLTALHFGKELQRGVHIGQIIEDYQPDDPEYDFSATDTDVNLIKTNAFHFIREVSKSFKTRIAGAREYWVPADSIELMMRDPVTFSLYLGLLYTRLAPLQVTATDNKHYGGLLYSSYTQANSVHQLISDIADRVHAVQSQLEDFHQIPKKDRTLEDYMVYFRSATSLVSTFGENDFVRQIHFQLAPDTQSKLGFFRKKYTDMIKSTEAVLSIYTNVKDRNYSLAIQGVRSLYQMRYTPELAEDVSATPDIRYVINFLLEKGAFIASVAEAKTSQEVYEAVDMMALPVGSARIKRLSRFNIAVNAYSGLFTGYEQIYGLDDDGFSINSYGVSAPIGISISKGSRYLPFPFSEIGCFKKCKAGWSSTWSLMLVDLGAVAAFRFTDETTEQVPTIQLGDIFAPGIVWSLGFPSSPISFNMGVQAGPNLRKVNSGVNEFAGNTSLRYNVALCVDLPLFNLYTNK